MMVRTILNEDCTLKVRRIQRSVKNSIVCIKNCINATVSPLESRFVLKVNKILTVHKSYPSNAFYVLYTSSRYKIRNIKLKKFYLEDPYGY